MGISETPALCTAAYTFSEEEIMYAVRTQLSWTHLRPLMPVPNALARQVYMEMCRIEHCSIQTGIRRADAVVFTLSKPA